MTINLPPPFRCRQRQTVLHAGAVRQGGRRALATLERARAARRRLLPGRAAGRRGKRHVATGAHPGPLRAAHEALPRLLGAHVSLTPPPPPPQKKTQEKRWPCRPAWRLCTQPHFLGCTSCRHVCLNRDTLLPLHAFHCSTQSAAAPARCARSFVHMLCFAQFSAPLPTVEYVLDMTTRCLCARAPSASGVKTCCSPPK